MAPDRAPSAAKLAPPLLPPVLPFLLLLLLLLADQALHVESQKVGQPQASAPAASWSRPGTNLVYHQSANSVNNPEQPLVLVPADQHYTRGSESGPNGSVEYYDEYYEDEEVVGPVGPVNSSAPSGQAQQQQQQKQPPRVIPVEVVREAKVISKPPPPTPPQQQQYDDSEYYADYEELEEDQPPGPNSSTSTTSPTTSTTSTTRPVPKESPAPPQQLTTTTTPAASQQLQEAADREKANSVLIGEAIVSVVTTKSVVNGTYSVPDDEATTSTTTSTTASTILSSTDASSSNSSTSSSTEASVEEDSTVANSASSTAPTTTAPVSSSSSTTSTTTPKTTSTTIQAAVPTGRSVSGARFLPFPSVVDAAAAAAKPDQQQQQQQQQQQLDSTESINDKLDRVQSELSSGFLANGGRFVPSRRYTKKPFSITSLSLPSTSTLAPTSSPIAPITITTITKRPKPLSTTTTAAPAATKRPKFQTTLEDVEAFLPKDFPRASYKTTPQSVAGTSTKRPKYQTTLDDLDGFLPKDYRGGGSYRTGAGKKQPGYKTTSPQTPTTSTSTASPATTTTTTTTTTSATTSGSAKSSTDRSTGSTRAKALTTIEDISAFLPPGYKLKKEDATTEKSAILVEILAKSKLNVNGSTPSSSDSTTSSATTPATSTTTVRPKSIIEDIFAKSAPADISALLPPGYKPPPNAESSNSSGTTTTTKAPSLPIQELLSKSSVDISALLPPGYKPENAKSNKSIKPNVDPTKDQEQKPILQELFSKSNVDISALVPPGFAAGREQSANGSKSGLVFPSRPGAGARKPIHKVTTQRPGPGGGSGAGGDPATPVIHKGWPVRVTTEFTGWPTSSTTPISIEKLLEAARTATVSSLNVSHVPSPETSSTTSTTSTTTTTTTPRPTTPGLCDENCEVAGVIRIVENAPWVPELLDRNTREWQDLAEEIEREMNLVFAKSPVLRKWYRRIRIDSFSPGSVLVDYFVELADMREKITTHQLKAIFHDSLRTFGFDDPMEVGLAKGPVKLGKFTIDPKSTDFIVIPRGAAPKMSEDENKLVPQWAIAVIIIGVGGLLFTIVFGVSVLVNRQHGSKLKPSITAMFEEEAAKNSAAVAAAGQRPPATDYHHHVDRQQQQQSQQHKGHPHHDAHAMWADAGWHDKPFESTSHKFLVDGMPYERKYNMYDSWKSEWNGYYYPPTHASSSNFSRHHPDYDYNF